MKKKIKQVMKEIEKWEYYHNGFFHLSGAWVKVKNVRIEDELAIADVILCSGLGEAEEKYFDCEYSLVELDKIAV
jgi:hypothetical protein